MPIITNLGREESRPFCFHYTIYGTLYSRIVSAWECSFSLSNTRHLIARLRPVWQRLTTPTVAIDDPDRHYQSRLMASLFLLAIAAVIVFMLATIIFPEFEPDAGTQNVIRLVSIGVLLAAWHFSLRGRGDTALNVAAVVLSLILCVQAAAPGGFFDLDVLYYLSILVFVCGLFSTIRIMLWVFAVQMAAMLAMIVAGGAHIATDMILGPAIFNTILTLAAVVGVRYRRQLDAAKNDRIQQSEARYRALVNSISDMIYTVSPEGTVTSINPAISASIGWLPEEMLGKPFADYIHDDDLGVAMQTFMNTVSGQAQGSQELRIMGKDGTYRWLETTASPQIENGQIVAITGSGRDITERKLAEQARQRTERRLSMLVEQMPLAVIEQDLNTIITGWNPAAEQIFGYTAAEVLGKRGMNLVVPDHLRAHIEGVFNDMLAETGTSHSINENKTKDGRVILCEWHNILLADEDGRPMGFLCVATDITVRRQADEQRMKLSLVQERMSLLKRFMDALSHDFRTSLSQIETSRYLLEHDLTPEAASAVRPRFDNMAASVRHMVTQLGNLNTISALSDLRLAAHDLNKLVQRLVEIRRVAAEAKNLSLTMELSPDLPGLRVDEDKLHDALAHLLNNAIAYTPPRGSIRLQTRADAQHVYVDVIDSGIGIAPEHISDIFDLFYRVDMARSLNTGGVGLGLSIARLVAEAHGGSITVASALGEGSTFTLSLPVAVSVPLAEPT